MRQRHNGQANNLVVFQQNIVHWIALKIEIVENEKKKKFQTKQQREQGKLSII